MGLDSRIGAKFLVPGPGYGGFCFPKDTNAMAYMGKFNGVDLSLIETTIKSNERRKINMAKRILDMVADIKNPTIAVFFNEMPERVALLGQYPPLCRVCRRAGRCSTEPPQRKR